METYDSAKAARVWQRVQGEAEEAPRHQGLLQLISEEYTAAAQYLALSRRFRGRQVQQLQKMAEEARSNAACIKGIYVLLTGERPVVKASARTLDTVDAALRRCYGDLLRRMEAYKARSVDPEYGCIYAKLAVDTLNRSYHILALLGDTHLPADN